MRNNPREVPAPSDEFKGAQLGDARLGVRLIRVAEVISMSPAKSFPELFLDPSQLEATYRFLANDSVSPAAILEPHVKATAARARESGFVRVVHDTTTLSFNGDREGLGFIERGQRGFFGHFSLAVSADEERVPLGIVGLRSFVHTTVEQRRGMSKREKEKARRRVPRAKKESSRWERAASAAQQSLGSDSDAIHVMDQEADDYDLFAALTNAEVRFVVRGWSGRALADQPVSVGGAMVSEPAPLLRKVRLNARDAKRAKGRHPAREERLAKLHVRWAPIELRRPRFAQSPERSLGLWVVQVFEPDPPKDEVPIDWTLFTSEPVTCLADAAIVVDHYRARWRIEEFFKALKTGCSIEKRQLTSFAALQRALALFGPIAWHLLAMRSLARAENPGPASVLLPPEQLRLLAALLDEQRCAVRLPARPTIRDALLGIASIGGHLPRNGEPGWLVLFRGYQVLLAAHRALQLAGVMNRRSDQS